MTKLSDLLANAPDQSAEDTQANEGDTLFIGEGKKYSTTEEADKAIAFKEDHIARIEAENATLREAQQKAATLDEVLESIKQSNSTEQQSHQTGGEGNHLESQDIDALVAAAVQQNLQAATQSSLEESNSKQVFESLVAQYGSRASEVYQMKSAELGIDLDDLSKTSPKAVLEFFKEAPAPTKGSGYQSGTVNTANLTSKSNTEVGTYDYWNNQLKAGKISREKAFQEQHKSLQMMGPAKFYGQS